MRGQHSKTPAGVSTHVFSERQHGDFRDGHPRVAPSGVIPPKPSYGLLTRRPAAAAFPDTYDVELFAGAHSVPRGRERIRGRQWTGLHRRRRLPLYVVYPG